MRFRFTGTLGTLDLDTLLCKTVFKYIIRKTGS